ncbi:MAG: NAD(P)/FAD-dependent oxidoreductase [Oscillospiraceae bacterium]|nr:NAD(P)/FAD-dependent oxidoreductase [Oscillospiraceae bacterium]
MKTYDVIFIGSGHACWHGALILKMMGKRVALVERDLVGGTCTNYGCDAKILLDSPFELKEALERYRNIGITGESQIDWKALMQYKKQYIGALPAALEGLFSQFGFDLIRGEAKFLDNTTIRVGEETYSAKHFVIGTGQTYIPLDIPGKEYFHDSREFLDLDEIPEHVTFVGAGIISMEFASLCLALGKKVDIVTNTNATLEQHPQAYAEKIVEKMKAQGANFVFDATVSEIEKTETAYRLKTKEGANIETDYILVAVGRRANVDGMDLDKIGIEYSARGIKVDAHLRTTVKNIYASGDVIDKRIPKLTPTAEFESNYIALDILNPLNGKICYPAIPNLVFTLPRIAQVGVSVAEAEAHPEQYRVERNAVGTTMAWLNKNQRDEHFTFIFDQKKKLVGAAVFSDDAGAYIDILTIIINQKLGAQDLQKMIFSFPTQTYGLISSLIPLFLKK